MTFKPRDLIATALTLLLLAVLTVRGQQVPNEFIVQVSNYDKLAQHANNCTFLIKDEFAFTVCADGFVAIDEASKLINPSTAFKIDAKWSQVLGARRAPNDVRLDTYLSIVEDEGKRLTIFKKDSLETLNLELDKTDAPAGVVLGGYFSPDFVIFHISNGGQSFLQVHTAKTSLKSVAAVDSEVINYEVLDLSIEKNLFYVFVTRRVGPKDTFLEMIQVQYDSKAKKWQLPAQVQYELGRLQCADQLRVTEGLVVMACEGSSTLTIKRRSNMSTLFQKSFTEPRRYFEQLHVVTHKKGLHSYIFYTMSQNSAYRLGMIEVLLNEEKGDDDQLVINYGELTVPSNTGNRVDNDGPIKLGGGDHYLLTTFESFSQIKGYTMCAYDQVIQGPGQPNCAALPDSNQFVLNPFDETVTQCGQEVLGDSYQKKLAFLCTQAADSSLDMFTIIVLVALGFGLLCCCTSFCIFCKYRPKPVNAIDDENLIGDRVHDPVAAQRIMEQQNKQKLTLIGKQLPRKKYSNTAYKENQESCAICVEEFLPATMIRETPCKHIFHDHCVMKWVETKLQQPDCPFCRAEISINAAR